MCRALDKDYLMQSSPQSYDMWALRFYRWEKWDAEQVSGFSEVTWLVRGDIEHQTLVSLTPGLHPLLLLVVCVCSVCMYRANMAWWHSRHSPDVRFLLFCGWWQARTAGLLSRWLGCPHTKDTAWTPVSLGWNDKHEEGKGLRALWTLWGIQERYITFWVIICHWVVILAHILILSQGSWFLLLMKS